MIKNQAWHTLKEKESLGAPGISSYSVPLDGEDWTALLGYTASSISTQSMGPFEIACRSPCQSSTYVGTMTLWLSGIMPIGGLVQSRNPFWNTIIYCFSSKCIEKTIFFLIHFLSFIQTKTGCSIMPRHPSWSKIHDSSKQSFEFIKSYLIGIILRSRTQHIYLNS